MIFCQKGWMSTNGVNDLQTGGAGNSRRTAADYRLARKLAGSGTARSIVKLLLAACIAADIAGATITWDGGGGDSSWHNPRNWNSDVLPGPGDDVVLGPQAQARVTQRVEINGFQAATGCQFTVSGTNTQFTAAGPASVASGARSEPPRNLKTELATRTRHATDVTKGSGEKDPKIIRPEKLGGISDPSQR